MAKRQSFLLRTDPDTLEALRRWANDDLRSVNGQIEFLLRRALRDAGRLPIKEQTHEDQPDDPTAEDTPAN